MSIADQTRPREGALSAVFFTSGAAALIFEAAWFYRAGLVFGSSVWAASVVLSSFMTGLALGSAIVAWGRPRFSKPLVAYATLEVVVAASGVALTAVMPALAGVVGRVAAVAGSTIWLANVLRFPVAFALLLIPATAMGATLPLLVGAVCRWHPGFGRALGRLYGWNTIGAVVGVLTAEVVLVRFVGVMGSAAIAGGLNLAAGGVAYRLSSTTPAAPGDLPPADAPGTLTPRAWRLVGAACLAGAALVGLELVWFRFLSMYVLTTTLAMNIMLAVVLASIGIGSLLAARRLAARPAAVRLLPAIAIVSAVTVAVSYWAFGWLTAGTQVGEWLRVLWFAVVLAAPASALSGAIFTFTGEAIHAEIGHETSAAAWLTLSNTVGAALGPLVAAFVLLPTVGMERSFQVASLVYGLIAVLAAQPRVAAAHAQRPRRVSLGWTAAAIVAALAVVAPSGRMQAMYIGRSAAAYASDGAQVVATREGPSETIFLMQQAWFDRPVYNRLVTNGFSMSGTAIPAERYMRYFVYWPMLLSPSPIERVLIVCYGVGVTAGAATDVQAAKTIDIVEISKDVLAMSDVIYPGTRHPLHDPRVRVHTEDGRYFLETTDERFDLITGEPPPPRTPGAVNIYTREYFQLIYDHLSDRGIATYWLPVARPDPGTDVNTIVRAFCDVFTDCSLWNATPFDFMLVGSRGGQTQPLSRSAVARAWRTPEEARRLAEVGFEQPEQVGATFLADASALEQLTADTPALTDDYPQRLRPDSTRPSLSDPAYQTDPVAAEMYLNLIDPSRAREAFAHSTFIRAHFAPSLVDGTLPFFEVEGTINRVLWEGGKPLRQIEDLHHLLTTTTLETLPLWILGSDAVKQTIAAGATDATGTVAYARGLGALASRNYAGAVQLFTESERQGFRAATLRPLLVYALTMAGRVDVARELAKGADVQDPDARHFWSWIGPTLGVGPFAS
jgi:spermidine synthase